MLKIAIGASARSKVWKNTRMSWQDFADRLKTTTKSSTSLQQFLKLSKADQDRIKDVGGYVGGYLKKGRRTAGSVDVRQILTLDLDFANMDFWDDFTLQFSCNAILHSTHKHSAESPRFRLVVPLSEEVSADKYEAVARTLAGDLGIELFDSTTFEPNRLMYWPSTPADQEYYFKEQIGGMLDPGALLDRYSDWTDCTAWPTTEAVKDEIKDRAEKQADPREKDGLIGSFCRAYTIQDTIEKFLSDKYTEGIQGRYTYTGGSASSGLVIYDDAFAYSHHGTDPISGKLCNAFDLCRIHLFGHMDRQERYTGKSPSFKAMEDLVAKDDEVKRLFAAETMERAKSEFSVVEDSELEDPDWALDLEMNKTGGAESSAKNISLILENDPNLKNVFGFNLFDSKKYIMRSPPWRDIKKPEPIRDVDYSGIRNYFDLTYKITGVQKISDSLTLEFEKRSFHPVRDYLNSLVWDGQERIKHVLPDYFGCEDNRYTELVFTKFVLGAVGRVMVPGIKFDLVMVLVGTKQGVGKSFLLDRMGREWFSDTFLTVHGKDALEQIQGSWIIEMAELSGLRKAAVESIKHFISKRKDEFRKAYAETPELYLRQCVFAGTTNNRDFLKDPSGNRRFLPVDVVEENIKKDIFTDLTDEKVGQIWAEAVQRFKKGEKLYLEGDEVKLANHAQDTHSEVDDRQGLILDFLDLGLPKDWNERSTEQRRDYILDPIKPKSGLEKRETVCMAEIWCECLGKPKNDLSRYNTRELNDIMRSLPDWRHGKSTKSFNNYGRQKYYERKKKLES